VLKDNVAMLNLVRKLGFEVRESSEPDRYEVVLKLG